MVSHHPADTGRKLNVHKTFRRRPGRLLNVLCTFNLRPVSAGCGPENLGYGDKAPGKKFHDTFRESPKHAWNVPRVNSFKHSGTSKSITIY